MIRKDGYYISEGFPWVDWHASHKFEGVTYKILRFFKEEKLLMLSEESTNFDPSKLRKPPKDQYHEFEKVVEVVIDPTSKWSVKRQFTVLSPEVLLDEKMNEYRFVPMNTPV